jgi:hypothetical protein
MMLVAQRPFAKDALYQLSFQLTDAQNRLYPLEIGVCVQWLEAAAVQNQTWVGLHIIDIAEADAKVLREWLQRDNDR